MNIDLIRDALDFFFRIVDHGYVVMFLGKVRGDAGADKTRATNHNLHVLPSSFAGGLPPCVTLSNRSLRCRADRSIPTKPAI